MDKLHKTHTTEIVLAMCNLKIFFGTETLSAVTVRAELVDQPGTSIQGHQEIFNLFLDYLGPGWSAPKRIKLAFPIGGENRIIFPFGSQQKLTLKCWDVGAASFNFINLEFSGASDYSLVKFWIITGQEMGYLNGIVEQEPPPEQSGDVVTEVPVQKLESPKKKSQEKGGSSTKHIGEAAGSTLEPQPTKKMKVKKAWIPPRPPSKE